MKRILISVQVAAIVFTSLFFASCGNGTQNVSSAESSNLAEALTAITSSQSDKVISSEKSSSGKTSSLSDASKTASAAVGASSKNAGTSGSVSKSYSKSSDQTAEKSGGMNIMAIGSSNVYRYFVPAVLYDNYGYYLQVVADASTSGKMIKYYIAEAEKLYDPDLYVVELRWFIKKQVPPKRNKSNLKNAYRDVIKIKDTAIRALAATEMLNMGLESNPVSLAKLKADEPKWFDTSNCTGLFDKTDEFFGYKPSAKCQKLATTDYSSVKQSKAFSTQSEADLRTLLEYCKKNKLNVLFTLSPYFMTESEMMLHNTAAEIVKSYGYKLFDSNKKLGAIGIDYSKDFYNEWHTNVYGARKYTEYLGKYIKSNYKLKSPLSDKQKSVLDNGLKSYNKKYADSMAKLQKKWG